jgi:pimeloyl-ACP methyl ester carboxylesterase
VIAVRLEVNGTGLEVEDRGSGAPVMLLHGWPDSHRLWRHQVAALTVAGYRTIAPDLRGFGESDRPAEVEAYSLLNIAGDVLGVLDHLGIERAHVVGHDWGAALAWAVAAFAPERVDHLAVLSVGHPSSFRRAGFEQREKSWYMLLFQFDGVAEQWLSADDFANFRAWSQHPEADAVIADLARPGALTATLNWYRANVPPTVLVEPPLEIPPVSAPTLGIWSSGDFALTEAQMSGSAAHVTGTWRYERVEGAGHWMQLEQPDSVSKLLLDFLPPRREV